MAKAAVNDKSSTIIFTDRSMSDGAKIAGKIMAIQGKIAQLKSDNFEVFEALNKLQGEMASLLSELEALAAKFKFVGDTNKVDIGNGFSYKRKKGTARCSLAIYRYWPVLAEKGIIKAPSTSAVVKVLNSLPREISAFLSDGSPVVYKHHVGKPKGLDLPSSGKEDDQQEE